jgi:hypothetical protein
MVAGPGDIDTLRVEYSCDSFELLDASPVLPRSTERSYSRRPPGNINCIVLHQTQGGTKPGLQGVTATATYHVRSKGWPGIGYTFFLPLLPDIGVGGRPRIYRCHADDVHSFHTGRRDNDPGANHNGVAIAFQGLFKSKSSPDGGSPSGWQRTIFRPFLRYLFERYGLSGIDVFCHSDFGKADCPGFEIESWCGAVRDDAVRLERRFDDWRQRQDALVELGYLGPKHADGTYGEYTRRAVEALEDEHRLPESGLWTRRVETIVRHLLKEKTR